MSHLNVNGVDKPLDHIYVNTGSIVKEAWEAKSRVILHGLTNPLCGIGTYKDILDLSTGALTRYVKKLVLTGNETWYSSGSWGKENTAVYYMTIADGYNQSEYSVYVVCDHYLAESRNGIYNSDSECAGFTGVASLTFRVSRLYAGTKANFIAYLAAQYAAGTPVTVWYVLATPTTETITVPSNLTGIVEGYLTQTGTPSPTNPIYPTANGTLEQGGTYSLDTGAYAIAWGRADTFTGTNSISARCYGLPVKSWEIDGNSQQSGVPAPDDPITPEFVGERTGNLFDISTATLGKYINAQGVETASTAQTPVQALNHTDYIEIQPNTDYTYHYQFRYGVANTIALCWFDASKNLISRITKDIYALNNEYTLSGTSPANAAFCIINFTGYLPNESMELSFNSGSTALPYEPYGWKLHLTSAEQTQAVYLGQVQTMRRIMKLVLTGKETDGFTSNGRGYIRVRDGMQETIAPRSDKLIGVTTPASESPTFSVKQLQTSYQYVDSAALLIKSDVGFTTFSDLKDWLHENAPITVWYVLATPVTGIVNEPLAKIGDYADTLTSDQAGVTIPTTDGNNTITVDTSLAPSRFEIKVHAKPITKPIHYGFKIDKSVSDPSNAVIYTHDAVTMTPAGMDFTNGVFDYGSWENVWFVKNARPVMLNFDGTEAYDLDPDDYSKKLDGTLSDIADSTKGMNAMIAFPTVWIKRTDDGSYNYIEISDQQIDSDFHAYAHEDANGVVKPYIYLPIYKGSLVDGKLRSISGVKPQSSTTAQQEVDAASALGTGWQIWDYTSKEMLCDLLTLISKSLDTQGKFGQGHSTGGRSASDFLNCGTLNDKGKFFGYSTTTSQVKCFGMEALWAERLDRELGLILDTGVYKIKEHPTYNLTGEGYTEISTSVAKSPTSSNYIKTEVSTPFGSLPTVVGGTSAAYYCDYFYQNQSGIRVAIRGGDCSRGAGAGLRYATVSTSASTEVWNIGASPVYK